MNEINQIIENIKKHLPEEQQSDKAVAHAIGLKSANHLSLHKNRNTIPVIPILDWCHETRKDMESILYYGGSK